MNHTIYTLADNPELVVLFGAGLSNDTTPRVDQLNKVRNAEMTIGAVEFFPIGINAVISGDQDLTLNYGDGGTLELSADASYDFDGGALAAASDYSSSWEVSTSPSESGISISDSGVLTVAADVMPGEYDAVVTLTVSNDDFTGSVDVTVKVKVLAVAYTISYDLDGGSLTTANPETYDMTSADITLNNPTKEDYDFAGWSGTDLTNKVQAVTISKGSTGDREYTANFTPIIYTITYELDGGTVDGTNPETYTIESEDITLINPTKEGYTFTGWTGTGLTEATETVTIAKNSTGNREYTATYEEDDSGDSGDSDNDDEDVFETSGSTTTYTNDNDEAVTVSSTVFSFSSDVVLSIDIAITLESSELSAFSGEPFSSTVSVDVNLTLMSSDYTDYAYSMDITGLPDWLSFDESLLTSTDTLEDTGGYEYHYEFIISGTPSTSQDTQAVTFNAEVKVTGINSYDLTAYGSADVNITVSSLESDSGPKSPYGDVDEEDYYDDEEIDNTSEDIPETEPIESTDNTPSSEDLPNTYLEVSGDSELQPSSLTELLSGMTEEEKQNVTVLKIDSNVTNLSGLDELPNLEHLDLTEARSLETIDISGNTSIKSIDISGNTNIRSLNLSGSNLRTLEAGGCENLEEINIEGCEELEYLDVSSTSIQSLNASYCRNLKGLNCSSCDINTLNLEGCDSLTELDCSNNSLSRLNAGNLPSLSDLYCMHQKLYHWRSSRNMSFLEFFIGNLFLTPRRTAADDYDSELYADLRNIENLRAYDEDGKELNASYNKETGDVTFRGVPAVFTYDYITGFRDVVMDVMVISGDLSVDISGSNASEDETPAPNVPADNPAPQDDEPTPEPEPEPEPEPVPDNTPPEDNTPSTDGGTITPPADDGNTQNEPNENNESGTVGSSGGGCDSRLGVLGLMMVLVFLKKR